MLVSNPRPSRRPSLLHSIKLSALLPQLTTEHQMQNLTLPSRASTLLRSASRSSTIGATKRGPKREECFGAGPQTANATSAPSPSTAIA